MDKNIFLEKFVESLALLEDVDFNNELESLEEWDSMGYVSVMAMLDDDYDINVSADDLRECVTIEDIYNLAIENN